MPSSAEPRTTSPARGSATRVFVALAAGFWGLLFFGVIDLLTVLIQDERFDAFYLLETGWGLLFTMLVAVPLLAFAATPRAYVFLVQVTLVAVGVLLPALLVPAAWQALPAMLLALTAALAWFGTGYRSEPLRRISLRAVSGPLAVLTAVAVLWASAYAWHLVRTARTGRSDDDTWGLMHLPMQAGFGLALAGAAVASLLVGTAGGYAWRASTLLPAISAVWFGAVSIAYPDHVGSLGALGGTACAVWGVSFLVSSVLATPRWESPSTARRLSRP